MRKQYILHGYFDLEYGKVILESLDLCTFLDIGLELENGPM